MVKELRRGGSGGRGRRDAARSELVVWLKAAGGLVWGGAASRPEIKLLSASAGGLASGKATGASGM